MVKIVSYKTYQRENGKEFYALVVQGGIEAVKSKTTNRNYLTVKEARVPCTFDEEMCKSLIGTELDGRIERIETEPYEYINKETGEIMILTSRLEFIDAKENILMKNVIDSEVVE